MKRKLTICFIILSLLTTLNPAGNKKRFNILKPDGSIDPTGLGFALNDITTRYQLQQFNRFTTIPDDNQIGEGEIGFYHTPGSITGRLYTILDGIKMYMDIGVSGSSSTVTDTDCRNSTGTLRNEFIASTKTITILLNSVAQSTGTLRNETIVSTGTILWELRHSTGTGGSGIDTDCRNSTGTIQNQVNNVITSTGLITSIAPFTDNAWSVIIDMNAGALLDDDYYTLLTDTGSVLMRR